MAEKEVQSLLHCVYTLCNAATRNALLVQKPIMPNKKNGLGISRFPNPFICNVLLLSANIRKESEMNMLLLYLNFHTLIANLYNCY